MAVERDLGDADRGLVEDPAVVLLAVAHRALGVAEALLELEHPSVGAGAALVAPLARAAQARGVTLKATRPQAQYYDQGEGEQGEVEVLCAQDAGTDGS